MPSAPQKRAWANGRSRDTQTTAVLSRPGGQLVELAHARLAHAGVDAREDVEHDALAGHRGVGESANFESDELEARGLGSDRGQLADGADGVVTELCGCHGSQPRPPT